MKRFLVVNPFGIGDAIFSMTLAEAIRAQVPDAFIGFVGNERTKNLIRMNSSIDRTYVFNRDLFRRLWSKHPLLFLKKLRSLLGFLKEERYDAVFDLSLGREYAFFTSWIGISERIGLNYKGRGFFLNRKLRFKGYSDRHVVDAQLDLLPLAGLERSRVTGRLPFRVPEFARVEADTFLSKAGIRAGEPLIVLAPGGGRSWGVNAIYKQWSPERFAKAVNLYCVKHPSKVIVVGDRSEETLLAEAALHLGAPSVLVAGKSLEFVSACLERANILFCNDGGLMHLANALGVKTVAVFGPVDPAVYGAYGTAAAHRSVVAPVLCRPCYAHFHFPPCMNDRRCLTEIQAETVASAAEEIA